MDGGILAPHDGTFNDGNMSAADLIRGVRLPPSLAGSCSDWFRAYLNPKSI